MSVSRRSCGPVLSRLGAFMWAVTVGDWSYAEELFRFCDLCTDYMDPPDFIDFDRSGVVSEIPSEIVYFVQAATVGLIKIGTTTGIKRRLMALQTASPVPLRFLGFVAGAEGIEEQIHGMFAEHRRHGEWFEPAPQLLHYIEANAWKAIPE